MRVVFSSFHQHAARFGRVAGAVRAQPSWLMKLVLLALIVGLAALGLLVIIPAVLLALVVLLLGGIVAGIRGAIRRTASWFYTSVRRGDASGRRNVRVMPRG